MPDEVIRRRFVAGIRNFFELYQPIADAWTVFDSSMLVPEGIAEGSTAVELKVIDAQKWRRFRSFADEATDEQEAR